MGHQLVVRWEPFATSGSSGLSELHTLLKKMNNVCILLLFHAWTWSKGLKTTRDCWLVSCSCSLLSFPERKRGWGPRLDLMETPLSEPGVSSTVTRARAEVHEQHLRKYIFKHHPCHYYSTCLKTCLLSSHSLAWMKKWWRIARSSHAFPILSSSGIESLSADEHGTVTLRNTGLQWAGCYKFPFSRLKSTILWLLPIEKSICNALISWVGSLRHYT